MDTKSFNFTKKSVEKIESTNKRTTYHDTKTHGLKLVVQHTGTKSFTLYRKIDGKPERIPLGRFPEVTIEQARAKADKLNAQIAQGINPKKLEQEQDKEWTLNDIFQLFIERHAKLHKKTWQGDVDQYRLYLKQWGGRKHLSTIKKVNIQQLHAKLGEHNGKYTANRVLALLTTLFNKAIAWGWEHPNPADKVPKYKEASRERFLQADELERFFKAVAEEPNVIIRDYVLISLLTGARRSNVQAMSWHEINFDRATWSILETKNGLPQTIPLLPVALDILRECKKNSTSQFVFPGTGKTGHLTEPKKGWKRILERAGIEDLRLHDLRRSLGSWQASTGASLSIIGKTLNHKDVATTAIYARLNIDPVREAMGKAVDAILTAAGIKSHADITTADNNMSET